MQARYSTLIAVLFLAVAPLVGQENPEKSPFDPKSAQIAQLPLPSPYDKMLAIESAAPSKVDWNPIFDAIAIDIDANSTPDKTAAALALGVKIADGLVAVKSQDVEKLNRCATQIESLATKLGAGTDELRRARLVRENANKGKWLDVFLELGFLQADIMKILNKPENANMRRLIIASGWMQGARHVTYFLSESYDPAMSNVLREPLLVAELTKDIQNLPPDVLANPRVAGLPTALKDALPLVSIEKDQPVSKENVDKLKSLADGAVKSALDQ
jgi:hypothetical protein